MAPDTPPKTILEGLRYKRGLELDKQRDIAQTLIGSLIALSEGGEYLDIVGHLYPPNVKQTREVAKKEAEDMNTSVTALDWFRSIGDRLEDE